MDRHRTSQPADGDEQVGELRFRTQQLRELVEDDEQRRHGWMVVFAGQPVRLVVGDVGVVAGLPQDLLPSHHLAAQRLLHAVHQGQFRFQVRDHGRDVGQIRHAREGGATLEVDQDEVQLLRRMRHRHRQHQGAQHLRLARTGGSDQQAVRPHSLLGGFLDVQDHRNPFGGDGERHPQPVAALPSPPLPVRVEVTDIAGAQQLHQVLGAFRVRFAHRGLGLGTVLRHPGGHASRDGFGLGDAHRVRGGQDRFLVQQQQFHASAVAGPRPGMQDHAQGRARGHRTPRRHGPHHGDPLQPADPSQGGVHRQAHPIQDQEQVRPVGGFRTCSEHATSSDLLPEELHQLLGIRRHHAGRPQGVAELRGPGVGKPFHPFPLVAVLLGAENRDAHRLRRTQGGDVHRHGTHLGLRRLRGPGHVDVAEVTQHDPQRQFLDHRVGIDETPHGGEADHVGFGQWRQLRFHQLHRQLLRRGTQPHVRDHLVVGVAFPQACSLVGDQNQGIRGGQLPADVVALPAGHGANRLAGFPQIGQVFPAQGVDFLAVPRHLPVDVETHHHEHREDHGAGHEQHPGVLPLRERHEHHDAHRAHHRDHGHQGGAHAGGLGLVGGNLDLDLPGGKLGSRGPLVLYGLNHALVLPVSSGHNIMFRSRFHGLDVAQARFILSSER